MAKAPVSRETTNGTKLKPIAGGDGKPAEPMSVPTQLLRIPLESIDIGDNVRVNVEEIDELAASIVEHGVIQPVKVVAAAGDRRGRFDLVYGQRRVLASRQAGQTHILAIVDLLSSDVATAGPTRSIEQLVENLHRADLNPIDRAKAMREVVDSGVKQADLARMLGLAPSTVANDVGLLAAPPKVQELLADGKLTPAHARALKGLDAKAQVGLAVQAIERGLSAHDTERMVQDHKRSEEWQAERAERDAKAAKEAAERLTDQLGNLAKKKVALDAQIFVVSWEGKQQGALVDRIKALGYTNVEQARSDAVASRSSALGCDCGVWRVELDYGALKIVPGCKDVKHQAAKQRANDEKRRAKDSVEASVHDRLAKIGPSLVNVWDGFDTPRFMADRDTARMLLWHSLDYRLADWSEEHGGTRSNPWKVIAALDDRALATELGKAIAKGFRDRYGYHVDWLALAVDLGLAEAPAPTFEEKKRPRPGAAASATASAIVAPPATAAPTIAPRINAGVKRTVPKLDDRVLVEGKTFEVLYIEFPPYATDETSVVGLVPADEDRVTARNGVRYAVPLSSLSGSSKKGWSSSAPLLTRKAFDAAQASPA